MTERKVVNKVRGRPTVDGAGVHLVRVLDRDTVKAFDPFLMLDSFDSKNPMDYAPGFPMHPHRGIETVSYLIHGEMEHMDSLGNKGTINDGESQWMTAGSGIMHQEMPQPVEHMLGVQLWINLPRNEKMTVPHYFDIRGDMIGTKVMDNAVVRVISGEFQGVKGVRPKHIQATYYDVDLKADSSITIDTKADENVFIFLIQGDAIVDGELINEKTAVRFGDGDTITVSSPKNRGSRFLFLSGRPIHEEVAWGGPIVMNTRSELETAFRELQEGKFVKHRAL